MKYAEEHDLYNKYSIIDCDVHESQPFSCFSDYLPEQWKIKLSNEELMRNEKEYIERMLSIPGPGKDVERATRTAHIMMEHPVRPVGGGLTFERYLQTRSSATKRPETGLANLEEIVDKYLTRMRDIGVKKTLVLPGTILFLVPQDPRPDLDVACCTGYTEFMLDKILGKYDDILTTVPAPARTPSKAVELIEKAGNEKNVVGVYILSSYEKHAGDDSYFPIYEIAQEKRLPIIFHGDPELSGLYGSFHTYFPINALSFPIGLIKQLTGLVSEGIFERFQHLKFAFLEGGLAWVPWIMHRLDLVYMEKRRDAPLLRKLPSEYIADRCFVGTQPIETIPSPARLKWLFDFFRERGMMKNLVYCSDYPHPDWDAPSAVHQPGFLKEEEKRMILGENAKHLLRVG